jgi:hypothetical protein
MEVPFDPAVTGALRGEADVSFEQVRRAIATAFARRFEVVEWRLDARTRELGAASAADHLAVPRAVAS